MTLSSMTGYAALEGGTAAYGWSWEIRSVNGKGLDVKLRLPVGWESLEPAVRSRVTERLGRGNVAATLQVRRQGAVPQIRINEDVLAAVAATFETVRARMEVGPPTLDGLLALKGVMEIVDEEDEEERRTAEAGIVKSFVACLDSLVAMRRGEGEALGTVLAGRLDALAALRTRAETVPGRAPEAVRARLAQAVAALLATSDRLDADRLHSEAILLAAKADVREELDRLAGHVEAARQLLAAGGAVGRRLDFLCQELTREANTLCAKSNDMELTGIGLEMKAVIEQFREQVQNVE